MKKEQINTFSIYKIDFLENDADREIRQIIRAIGQENYVKLIESFRIYLLRKWIALSESYSFRLAELIEEKNLEKLVWDFLNAQSKLGEDAKQLLFPFL